MSPSTGKTIDQRSDAAGLWDIPYTVAPQLAMGSFHFILTFNQGATP